MKAHAWKDDRCTRCGVVRKNFAHKSVDLNLARGTSVHRVKQVTYYRSIPLVAWSKTRPDCIEAPKRLSPAMVRALRGLVERGSLYAFCKTESDYGGLVGTLRSLRDRGLLDENHNLTKEGRAAYERSTK